METKGCLKCGRDLPLEDFYKTGRARGHSWCKSCFNDYTNSKRRAAREAEPDGGAAFKAAEAKRVKAYQADPDVRARRAVRSKVQYRALDELRQRYPEEHAQLTLRVGKGYPALSALREAHREEYDRLYVRGLERAGLDGR
jgi:hypothetical protein